MTDGQGRKEIWRSAKTRPKHRNDMALAEFARSCAPEPDHKAHKHLSVYYLADIIVH